MSNPLYAVLETIFYIRMQDRNIGTGDIKYAVTMSAVDAHAHKWLQTFKICDVAVPVNKSPQRQPRIVSVSPEIKKIACAATLNHRIERLQKRSLPNTPEYNQLTILCN